MRTKLLLALYQSGVFLQIVWEDQDTFLNVIIVQETSTYKHASFEIPTGTSVDIVKFHNVLKNRGTGLATRNLWDAYGHASKKEDHKCPKCLGTWRKVDIVLQR